MIKRIMTLDLSLEVALLSNINFVNEKDYEIKVRYEKSIYRMKDDYFDDNIFKEEIENYLNILKKELKEKLNIDINVINWDIKVEVKDLEIKEEVEKYLKRNEIILDIDLKDLEEIIYREQIDSILNEREITIL